MANKKTNRYTSKSRDKNAKATGKKISIKDVVVKIKDTVKKPFQKKKPIDIQKKIDRQLDSMNGIDKSSSRRKKKPYKVDVPFAEQPSNISTSSFFYSSDDTIDRFDDKQLYENIIKHYPGLSEQEQKEVSKRTSILALLNDIDLMTNLLEDYNMNILDFIRFLFRLCPSIFKGFFIKKIQKTIRNKAYAKQLRFSTYKSRCKQKGTKKRSIL